jgi:hypothetical protein
MVEDIVAGTTTVLALLIAPLAACLIIGFLALGAFGVIRVRAWARRRKAGPPKAAPPP